MVRTRLGLVLGDRAALGLTAPSVTSSVESVRVRWANGEVGVADFVAVEVGRRRRYADPWVGRVTASGLDRRYTLPVRLAGLPQSREGALGRELGLTCAPCSSPTLRGLLSGSEERVCMTTSFSVEEPHACGALPDKHEVDVLTASDDVTEQPSVPVDVVEIRVTHDANGGADR